MSPLDGPFLTSPPDPRALTAYQKVLARRDAVGRLAEPPAASSTPQPRLTHLQRPATMAAARRSARRARSDVTIAPLSERPHHGITDVITRVILPELLEVVLTDLGREETR